MNENTVIEFVCGLDGVVAWRPAQGDPVPEIAWGDTFFYVAPDGQIPTTEQPFATIVTKNYPDDAASDLDHDGVFRVNVHAGRDVFTRHTGYAPRDHTDADLIDFGERDVVLPHPVYASAGWLSVVNPGARTTALTRTLLTDAAEAARLRYLRRSS